MTAPPTEPAESPAAPPRKTLSVSAGGWLDYGRALVFVAAATALKSLLYVVIGLDRTRIPFALFYLTALLSTLYGSFAAGLFAVLLSALVTAYFFMPPLYSFDIGVDGWLQVSVFVAVSLLLCYFTERSKRAETRAHERGKWLSTTLRSIGDAVIATDTRGCISFINPVAQKLTGWSDREAKGRALGEVFRIVNEATGEKIEDPVAVVLARGVVVGLANHTVLIARDGRRLPIEDSAAPIVNDAGATVGVVLVFHDVTGTRAADQERTTLAAQVEGERERLRNLVANVPGIVWEAWGEPDATSQRIDFVSDYVETMLGYSVEEWLSTPNFWLTIVHGEDREQAAREAHAIFESGRGGTSQFRWVTRQGQVVYVEAQSTVILDEAGRPAGMRGVTMDITARREAEEALDRLLVRERGARAEAEASEQRYRYLADSLPQIVWTARPDGYFDYYNERWYEYTVLTPEQSDGWGWQLILHPEDVERCLRRWATAIERGQSYEIEYRFRRSADGAYRWHLGRAVPMRDAEGRIVKWFGTATDIDDQKRAGERLRFLAEVSEVLAETNDYRVTLEKVSRLAVKAIADWCTIDLLEEDGRIERLTTHQEPEREASVRRLDERYPPRRGLPLGLSSVLQTGRAELYPEMTEDLIRQVARDEEHFEALSALGIKSSICVPLMARGRLLGAVALSTAESGRRYTEADLSFAEGFAHRVALAIDNARLFRRSEEANRAKDEFLATLSHELRTPLTPIIGWTHMLRGGRLPATETPHGLDVIDKNAQALTRLINDLLDMSAIMSGKMRIERMPVELGSILGEAIETVRAEADKRRIRLEYQLCTDGRAAPSQPIIISGDRTRLVQVFWNLLSNAVKFSAEGTTVSVRCEPGWGEAHIYVEDSGQGIPPEFLPYVFERFRQADPTTTRSHGGLGIGLALVKSFVEAHGGQVSAASDGQDRGSRFTITLPLLHADAPATETSEPGREGAPERVRGGRRRALLIEDARDTLEMLQAVFEGRGFETVACETAEQALRVASGLWFDIIVSDIGLPHIDGYELLRRLRQFPHLRHTPAVAFTGYVAAKDAEAALAAGYDMHIPKPVDPTVLADTIEQIIERKASDEEEDDDRAD